MKNPATETPGSGPTIAAPQAHPDAAFGREPATGRFIGSDGAGRSVAERIATNARKDGLGEVGVLDSSTRRPLRAGYYVAYAGPYSSGAAVRDAAAQAHALGYRTAYIRELVRY